MNGMREPRPCRRSAGRRVRTEDGTGDRRCTWHQVATAGSGIRDPTAGPPGTCPSCGPEIW